MKDYAQVKEVLDAREISQADQEVIQNFLSSFSFPKRQQLMGIFIGFPEKAPLFVELLKEKIEFQKKPTEELAAKILEVENNEIKSLMNDLV